MISDAVNESSEDRESLDRDQLEYAFDNMLPLALRQRDDLILESLMFDCIIIADSIRFEI